MRTFRVIELFSGVGAQRMALERVKARHPGEIDFEFVAQCDIDRHAVKSYDAIHGETPNLGDISKVETLPDCDVLTWSFPCQDLSVAGLKRGMEKGSGTRSGLCWEVIRLIGCSHRPEWLVMENVPGLLFEENRPHFQELIRELHDLGYSSHFGILSATDFGVAQNRQRCFMISHLGDSCPILPKPRGCSTVLRDYLEKNPDPKYYLSKEKLRGLIVATEKNREKGRGFAFDPRDPDSEISPTITTKKDRAERGGGVRRREEVDQGECLRCRLTRRE